MIIIHGIMIVITLTIVARLIELQILRKNEYRSVAQAQQYGGVKLPAKRGEILSRSLKTSETSILATNTTLDLLYVDPLILTRDHGDIADQLADILLTKDIDALCRTGNNDCPAELQKFYKDAYDPLKKYSYVIDEARSMNLTGSGVLFERVPDGTAVTQSLAQSLPDIVEMKRLFARAIEERIQQKNVTTVPLLYSATKIQEATVAKLAIPGIYVNEPQHFIYCNPQEIDQRRIPAIARELSPILVQDASVLRTRLVQRPLRYVPIMSRLPSSTTRKIRDLKEAARIKLEAEVAEARKKNIANISTDDPYRAIALIPEHWRVYPDTRIASHVTGFINALQEPQYGVERAFDSLLRGQEGLIASLSDPFGGQIISGDQTFIDPRDGATVVLTIDRFVQNKVEELLEAMVQKVDAESGQAIIMDPFTGKIIAMANAPRFDNNSYASVYEKEPIIITPDKEKTIVVEVFNPTNNARILKAYLPDIQPGNRVTLSSEIQKKLNDVEKLYNLNEVTRYYLYLSDKSNGRREIFPTEYKGVWLKYKNNIGVGSYVNRAIQEIYEPGSVMKSVTMAVALDKGEVVPSDTYDDTGPVKVDEYIIKNALNAYYGKVDMVGCINFSLNTCLQSVSHKLGRKLFYAELKKFGFGQVTGIELDNELPGIINDWRDWSDIDLSAASYGQGVSVTPLQMTTAYTALANGGKLMKPSIVDEIRYPDGRVEKRLPQVVGQVLKPETSVTITAMLINSGSNGFAVSGKPKGYRIAGKTGTSQIAAGGKYESGTGSTIATYAGYAPVDRPRFIILTKLDRPKKDDFGSRSAAPLFKDIATFLFDYYGIPPDDKSGK